MDLANLFNFNYTAFLLGFGRASGLLMVGPIFQSRSIPVQARVLFAMALALSVAPFIKIEADLLQINTWMAAVIMVQEILIGLIMGFMANLAFYAFQIAGYLMDIEIGFGMVNIIDPFTGTEMPLLGQFNYLFAGLVFLAINGHHRLILALVQSFTYVKPGMFFLKPEATGVFLTAFTKMFLLGFKMSLPVLGAILLTDVALGIIAKLLPQINVFFLGFGIKIVVGILILILFLPLYLVLIEETFARSGDTFRMLQLMLRRLTL